MQVAYSSQGLSFAFLSPGGANMFFWYLRTSTFSLIMQEEVSDANDGYSGFCFNRKYPRKTLSVYWKGKRGKSPQSLINEALLELAREHI